MKMKLQFLTTLISAILQQHMATPSSSVIKYLKQSQTK